MLAIICLISLTGLTTVVNNATDRLERRVRVVSAAHDPAQRDAVGRANGQELSRADCPVSSGDTRRQRPVRLRRRRVA